MKKTGRLYATCRCCQRANETVKDRRRRFEKGMNMLCEACWTDPHLKMSECLHGLPAEVK